MYRADARDPSYDFDEFVAERRGLTLAGARAQVAAWMASYEPGPRRAAPAEETQPPGLETSELLRICA